MSQANGFSQPDQPLGELPFQRLGHYDVVARIGRGGMGDVFQGYEPGLNRSVALKVLPAELARHADFVSRFRAEATAAAKLAHPGVVQIFFIGEDQGHHFFAMEFIDGESLENLLARRERMTADEVLPVLIDCLAGLQAAHEQGLVHRDVKPANILLDRKLSRAVLSDFGLVKSLEAAGRMTATSVVLGTADYTSPEQGRGKTVDGRSDLYSLGVVAFRMLAGRLPFAADSPVAMIYQHAYELPPALDQFAPDSPPAMAHVIRRLLAKSPQDRYPTAALVRDDLEAIRAGQPLPSESPPGTARSAPAPAGVARTFFGRVGKAATPSARPRVSAGLLVLALVLFGIAGKMFWDKLYLRKYFTNDIFDMPDMPSPKQPAAIPPGGR